MPMDHPPTSMNWDLNPNPPLYTLPGTPMLPALPPPPLPAPTFNYGCICPPTAEQTCRGDRCPRQPAMLPATA